MFIVFRITLLILIVSIFFKGYAENLLVQMPNLFKAVCISFNKKIIIIIETVE